MCGKNQADYLWMISREVNMLWKGCQRNKKIIFYIKVHIDHCNDERKKKDVLHYAVINKHKALGTYAALPLLRQSITGAAEVKKILSRHFYFSTILPGKHLATRENRWKRQWLNFLFKSHTFQGQPDNSRLRMDLILLWPCCWSVCAFALF